MDQFLWQVQQQGKIVLVIELRQTLAVFLAQAVDLPVEPGADTTQLVEVSVVDLNMVSSDCHEPHGKAMNRLGRLSGLARNRCAI